MQSLQRDPVAGEEAHRGARPMQVVKDDKGDTWLCDKGVDKYKDLKKQGCWRCGDLPFTRND